MQQQRKRVVLINPMPHPAGKALLAAEFEVIELVDPDEAAVSAAIAEADAAVVNPGGYLTAPVVRAAKRLQVIAVTGAGFDRVDLDGATERGIPVVNNTGLGAIPVAEHAIGMMISLAKDFRRADRMVREQAWSARGHYLGIGMGVELNKLTLGIIGLGNIGSITARLANAFGMRVLAYDPYLNAKEVTDRGAQQVTVLRDMLPECDFVTIHCPHNAETHYLISVAELRSMKATAYLINCARGPIVDTTSLVQALEGGAIAGAGIDTFEPEPIPTEHPLFRLDNVILSPHVAGITTATVEKLALGSAEQVIEVLSGKRPTRLVNPHVWEQFRERYPVAK